MEIYFLVGSIIFFVLGYILVRKDKRTGLIPDSITEPSIILAVVMNFFALGFFSFSFYLYFVMLTLLYLAFMFLQHGLHYSKQTLGSGDIKLFLLIFALIPFNPTAIAGLPIINILLYTIILMGMMTLFSVVYYSLLSKVPKFEMLYGSTMEKTSIRLAPLVWIAFIITFFVIV